MAERLLAWARAVKARHGGVPLWLFTDAARLPDPLAAAAALPRGLAGVVYRPEGERDPLGTGLALARLCRDRRLLLTVAGDARLAARLRAGRHLRRGRTGAPVRRICVLPDTGSAHSAAELLRAHRRGARTVFLSPLLATGSHPGQPALGPLRWRLACRAVGKSAAALGGVADDTVRRVPRGCRAAGAIGGLRQ